MSDEKERADLIAFVGAGEMTPQEAEAERQGIGPLEGCRDPERFDPLQERRWTMPMAVAWIAWRDPVRVRDQMNAYRKAWKFWRKYGRGWVLNSEERASLVELLLGQEGEDYKTVSDARADLWSRLQNEHLAATGIYFGTRPFLPLMMSRSV